MLEYLLQIDKTLFCFINSFIANPFFDWILPLLRKKETWYPFYVVLVISIIYFKRKKSIEIILLCIIALSLSDMISSLVLKPFFERIRPCFNEDLDSFRLLLSHCPAAFSFPSSHASNHFALAFILYKGVPILNRMLSFTLFLWAFSIAFAQIYVGVHYPSDVLFGAIVGCCIAYLTYYCYNLFYKLILSFR